ncbi:MAG: hypothetical protein V1847_01265 [Candidatus Diapherotrites archaeon]
MPVITPRRAGESLVHVQKWGSLISKRTHKKPVNVDLKRLALAQKLIENPRYKHLTLGELCKLSRNQNKGIPMVYFLMANQKAVRFRRFRSPQTVPLAEKKKILLKMVDYFLKRKFKHLPRKELAKKFSHAGSLISSYWDFLSLELGLSAKSTPEETEKMRQTIRELKR